MVKNMGKYKSMVHTRWYDINEVLRNERQGGIICSKGIPWITFKDYPFEQIIFSGGGVRGYSYCGAVKVNMLHSHISVFVDAYGGLVHVDV